MFSVFHHESKSVMSAAILLGVASFLSRLTGLLRDRLFAHLFGAGDLLDAYYAAFRIPDFVYNLVIVGAISAGFIPLFTALWQKNKDEAWRFVNQLMTRMGVVLLIVGVIGIFTAPYLIHLLTPGFPPEKQALTVLLTSYLFLSPIILGMSSIVSGVLQSFKNFLVYAITPILYNCGIIFGALVLVPRFGPSGLAFGVLLGALTHLIIQLPILFARGFRPHLIWRKTDASLHSLNKMILPRALSLGANEMSTIVMTGIASTLGVGTIAIFQFANNIMYVPVGVIGISFAVAAFPTFAAAVAEGNTKILARHLSITVRQILFFILPITVITLLLRAQIVRVAFGTGAFNWTATLTTANLLACFTLSLFAQCITPLLLRVFFALHDTRTPLLVSLFTAMLMIAGSIFLKPMFGLLGLGFSFSFASIIELVILTVLLRARIGAFRDTAFLYTLYKLSIATLIAALVIQGLKSPIAAMVDMTRFWGIFAQGTITTTVGLLVYLGITLLLKVEEPRAVARSIRHRFWHVRQVTEEVQERL